MRKLSLGISFLLFNLVLSDLKIRSRINQTKVVEPRRFINYLLKGTQVDIREYPTSVLFFNYGYMCAGSILNSWVVVTAAHCLTNNKKVIDMMIQVGTTHYYEIGADRYEVIYFDIHPKFNKLTQFDCDIALLFVRGPIVLGPKAQKAIIIQDEEWMKVTDTAEFIAAGWGSVSANGSISEHGLMMTSLKLVPNRQCQRLHNTTITANMLCLYGQRATDACRGDSGGGVTFRGFLVGIVSHGDGCATHEKPSIYTNVYKFRSWISSRMNNFHREYCNTQGFQTDVTRWH